MNKKLLVSIVLVIVIVMAAIASFKLYGGNLGTLQTFSCPGLAETGFSFKYPLPALWSVHTQVHQEPPTNNQACVLTFSQIGINRAPVLVTVQVIYYDQSPNLNSPGFSKNNQKVVYRRLPPSVNPRLAADPTQLPYDFYNTNYEVQIAISGAANNTSFPVTDFWNHVVDTFTFFH